MGYSFTIGNGTWLETDEDGETWARWEVPGVSLDSAPVFKGDELTGNSNSRHPSYSGWYDFCTEAGTEVFNLFYTTPHGHHGEGTLIVTHPGGVKLEHKHLNVIKNARIEREKKGTTAGFCEGEDYTLARLMWLEFWIDWALTNCETPIFENT